VFSVDLAGAEDEGTQQRVARVIDSLKVVRLVANIGDARSLVAHPASMTHSHLNAEQRAAAGISLNTIRLSAGLEDPRDIIADLDQALAIG
jgi:O-acetylhomoserine (thiol)-lyase